jgi:hypothetical protein
MLTPVFLLFNIIIVVIIIIIIITQKKYPVWTLKMNNYEQLLVAAIKKVFHAEHDSKFNVVILVGISSNILVFSKLKVRYFTHRY